MVNLRFEEQHPRSKAGRFKTKPSTQASVPPASTVNLSPAAASFQVGEYGQFYLPDEELISWGLANFPPRESPWGRVIESMRGPEPMGKGIWAVNTEGGGGLHFSEEVWEALPANARNAFTHKYWAEEKLEMPIALALLRIPVPWGPHKGDVNWMYEYGRRIAETDRPELLPLFSST